MASQSTSTSVGVGSSNEPTIVEVLETTRNKDIWQHYDLCKMSDGSKKGRCKQCGKFTSVSSNSALRLHIEKPYCLVRKVIPDGGQSSMSREGGLFAYEADRVRQQFAGFVIQQGEFELSGPPYDMMVGPMKEKLRKYFKEISPVITCAAALNPCFNISGVEIFIENISIDLNLYEEDINNGTIAKNFF
nr:zinc finger, BED-type, phospholipase-like, homeodomain-like protein [Tanacetum cinerariifolium]